MKSRVMCTNWCYADELGFLIRETGQPSQIWNSGTFQLPDAGPQPATWWTFNRRTEFNVGWSKLGDLEHILYPEINLHFFKNNTRCNVLFSYFICTINMFCISTPATSLASWESHIVRAFVFGSLNYRYLNQMWRSREQSHTESRRRRDLLQLKSSL